VRTVPDEGASGVGYDGSIAEALRRVKGKGFERLRVGVGGRGAFRWGSEERPVRGDRGESLRRDKNGDEQRADSCRNL